MTLSKTFLIALSNALLLSACGGGAGETQPVDTNALKITLGETIFNDSNLSEPAGQSCASCHDASKGFADPNVNNTTPVSEGVVTGQFGNRNAPTAAYAMFTPAFHYDATAGEYIGGQFVDGRASNLIEQAKGPFVNPVEMANADEAMVVEKVRTASYASKFRKVYGENSLDDIDTAYHNIADAIAAFESTDLFNPFSSKYDAVQAGSAIFTSQEANGLELFRNKGLCTECHVIQEGSQPLFTNFTYSNIGAPANPDNPVYDTDADFIDYGLANNPRLITSSSMEQGKFRVPTLRNVELTAPYLHNGALQTLEQVVNFYNTRDADSCYGAGAEPFVNCWPDYEVENNADISRMGDLLLSPQEEADLVAFLKTLTDGYTP